MSLPIDRVGFRENPQSKIDSKKNSNANNSNFDVKIGSKEELHGWNISLDLLENP